MKLTFEVDGGIKFIYDDQLIEIASEVGTTTIKRASHVEPIGINWFADMTPVQGPVLGPYRSRAEALDSERRWLIDNDVPRPR